MVRAAVMEAGGWRCSSSGRCTDPDAVLETTAVARWDYQMVAIAEARIFWSRITRSTCEAMAVAAMMPAEPTIGPSDDRRLNGIGAAVTHRPLPHHRAYGSVHGGSRS